MSLKVIAAVFVLALSSLVPVSEARYYGGYRGGGGVAVKRTTVVVGGGGGRYVGRRLLQDEQAMGMEEEGMGGVDEGECQTALQVIESRDDLSDLNSVIQDMPKVRDALDNKTATFTLFAPNNQAIESLKNWGSFQDIREALEIELDSNTTFKAGMLAYHIHPKETLMASDLSNDMTLDNALKTEVPLEIRTNPDGSVTVIGYGSEAQVVEADVKACNGVIHVIDSVLLPFDGDSELDEEQKARVAKYKSKVDESAIATNDESTAGDDSMASGDDDSMASGDDDSMATGTSEQVEKVEEEMAAVGDEIAEKSNDDDDNNDDDNDDDDNSK